MDSSHLSLPSSEEIHRVFQDFKQMLRLSHYYTPLQRVNRLAARSSSIAFSQKAECEAERVLNLLPPGSRTVHHVDFLRMILSAEQDVYLRIPISLLHDGRRQVLLMNDESGRVSTHNFDEMTRALQVFQEEVSKTGHVRALFPHFVHKSANRASTFHTSFDSAKRLWDQNLGAAQRLQQYIQPSSKKALLLRAHWKKGKPGPTYYFLSRGAARETTLPSLLSKIKVIDRSFSEADLPSEVSIKKSNLIVQRLTAMPDLNSPLETCLKLLNASLPRGKHVTEMVCDFTSAKQPYRWVFLSCEGYMFTSKAKLKTQTLNQREVIDLKFLMYPVVANKYVLKQRLKWTNKMRDLADQQHSEVMNIVESTSECSLIAPAKTKSYVNLRALEREEAAGQIDAMKECVAGTLLQEDVSHYDRLVLGSRLYKEEKSNKFDFLCKHGGESTWKPPLLAFYSKFHEDVGAAHFYEEMLGLEETDMVVRALLRIIKGDYNFYYKEALKNIHHKLAIPKKIYATFLKGIEEVLHGVTASREDTCKILHRFRLLEDYICHVPVKKA